MSAIFDLLVEEKHSAVAGITDQIRRENDKLAFVSSMDVDSVEANILEAIKYFELPADIQPSIYIYSDDVDVDFYLKDVSYDDVLQHNEACLSYNGNYLHAELKTTIGIVDATVHLEAKIPEDVDSILRACNKIQDVASTQKTAMC